MIWDVEKNSRSMEVDTHPTGPVLGAMAKKGAKVHAAVADEAGAGEAGATAWLRSSAGGQGPRCCG